MPHGLYNLFLKKAYKSIIKYRTSKGVCIKWPVHSYGHWKLKGTALGWSDQGYCTWRWFSSQGRGRHSRPGDTRSKARHHSVHASFKRQGRRQLRCKRMVRVTTTFFSLKKDCFPQIMKLKHAFTSLVLEMPINSGMINFLTN